MAFVLHLAIGLMWVSTQEGWETLH